MQARRPRILLIDIETYPMIIAAWRPWETNAIWTVSDSHLLSFAWKWLGGGKVRVKALPDYPIYKRDRHNDKFLVKDIHGLLDEADIVVAHNGQAFDVKSIMARMAIHRIPPPSPFKVIDTLKIARQFKFDSNKLDTLARHEGGSGKLPHTGKDMWKGCGEGDKAAWLMMRRYNAHDVDPLLERTYLWLRPYAKTNHPDLSAYGGACPRCQSYHVQARGQAVAVTRKSYRFHCQDCGHWYSVGMKNEGKDIPTKARAKTAPLRPTRLGRRNRNRAAR